MLFRSHTFLLSPLLLLLSCPQVHQGQEKIARLEQEKEHWLLEAQLGRVRLEKENQRISELQAQLCSALGGPASGPPGTPGLGRQEEEEQEEKGAGREATLSTSLVRPLSLSLSFSLSSWLFI